MTISKKSVLFISAAQTAALYELTGMVENLTVLAWNLKNSVYDFRV